MSNLETRPLEARHLPAAAALCRREVAYLPFSEAILQDRILDDPDFDPDLNPTVWQGERLVAMACGAPPSEELQTAGGVKLFAVASDVRRQGIATRMFDQIENRLASLGAGESVAIIAGNNRFMQGLDLRYTEALCFLEARGYERAGDGMDMDVDLRKTPLDTSEKEEELERDHGLRVRRLTMDDYQQAWDYVAREFEYPSALATDPVGRRWAYLATSGLKLNPPTLWMAEKDGEFCGFAVTDVAAPERLGPMGVSPEVRKLGVGTVLLKRALADLRARGVETGVIYGAGPYAFYARTVNAVVNAVFWRLRKPLP
ncbi:MAG: GNAT family N-acetyltransferase [Chloroflexi bacterium]|nr:GNAT family N-acetyltransferase [Chloroflexota bacterium]